MVPAALFTIYIDSPLEINIPYSIEFLADIDRTITRGRLNRYMVATSGNIDQALQLYEKNVQVSEALFGFLHGLEVSMRNSIDVVFSMDIGIQDWFQNGLPMPWSPAAPQTLQLTNAMQKMIADARSKAGSAATVGKLIAELPFGFWTLLLGNRFDDLWRRSLHRAFPHARTTRRVVHWRLDTIRLLRNRIAHHEPILSSSNRVYTGHINQPTIDLPALLTCASWMSPATADWLRTTTRYTTAIRLLSEIASSGITL